MSNPPEPGPAASPTSLDGVAHVVMVGLMGSGKSTVGHLIADRLGRPFRDSDAEIEANTGRTVREIRDVESTDAMHDIEAAQLLDVVAELGEFFRHDRFRPHASTGSA